MVPVLYFAQVRDRLGRDHDHVLLPEHAHADDILTAVATLHPPHAALIRRCRVALDHTFINTVVPITQTSEIALIPPVSGG